MYVRTYVRTYVRMYVCMFVCLSVCLYVWYHCILLAAAGLVMRDFISVALRAGAVSPSGRPKLQMKTRDPRFEDLFFS